MNKLVQFASNRGIRSGDSCAVLFCQVYRQSPHTVAEIEAALAFLANLQQVYNVAVQLDLYCHRRGADNIQLYSDGQFFFGYSLYDILHTSKKKNFTSPNFGMVKLHLKRRLDHARRSNHPVEQDVQSGLPVSLVELRETCADSISFD